MHSVTGYTPFHLIHGWEARVPYDLLVEAKEKARFVSVEEYIPGQYGECHRGVLGGGKTQHGREG